MPDIQHVAIVTGGSRGIGRAVALRLARDGFAVIVNYTAAERDARRVIEEIETAGGKGIAVRADVAEADAFSVLFDAAEQAFGRVDVLINNAGVFTPGLIAQTHDDAFERHFAINVRGTFAGMREAARRLRDGGRIINFSSTTLALVPPGYAIYNATKAAVEAMTKVAAKEFGGRGITVNAIAPGPVETELFLEGKSIDDIQRMAGMAPQKRLGRPDDITGAVAFLVSAEADWVSGQIIRINGGIG